MKKLPAFITSEKGVESAEYALLGLVIFLVIITAVMAFGDQIAGLYNEIVQGFSTPL
jgi:Flp pilus assembly pilin Flp